MMKGWGVLIVSLFCITNADAMTVVTASDNTIDATPYLQTVSVSTNAEEVLAQVKDEKMLNPVSALFPLTSELTPGHITTHRVNLAHLTTPLFIVSNDALSLEWLAKHKAQLQALHAQGIVTNLPDETSWKMLESQSGMTLLPASLDALSTYLPIKHYPCLISQYWVEQ